MRLYNQGGYALSWDDGAYNYKWEPYGFVDVADAAVAHIRAQKVNVDVSPVSPENRARSEADAAQSAALNSDTRKLQISLTAACADRDAAKAETERVKIQLTSLEAKAAEYLKAAQESAARCSDATGERDALKAQMAAMAVSGVTEADAAVAKLKAEMIELTHSLHDARDAEEKAKLSERNALAKASGSEAAALEALAKVDDLVAEVKALKKELGTRAAAEAKPKK